MRKSTVDVTDFGHIRYLVLWVTEACNLDCVYCYANAPKSGKAMNLDMAMAALSLPSGNFTLQISGGEPLLQLDLVEQIYKQVQVMRSTRKVKMQLQTNATLITPDIAKRLKSMDIALGMSLDGPMDVNEQSRGGTREAIEGIRCLAAEGIPVNLNAVITRDSIETLPKLADLAAYLGNVKGIGLDLLRKAGRGSEMALPTISQIDSGLRALYARTKALETITRQKIVVREIEEARIRLSGNVVDCAHYCYAAKGDSLVILPDGQLFPCGSLVGSKSFSMGNLMKRETWRNMALSAKRDARCGICGYSTFCAGACPARSLVNQSDRLIRFTEEDCQLRKTAFQIVEGEHK